MGRVKRVPVVMQMEALECGAASLGMVLAYWKKWLPLERLRIDCGVSRDGSNALNILKAARKYGMVAKGFRMEVERLRKVEDPAILHWNFCHFVVFNGFKGDKVSLNDPARGRVLVDMEEFNRSFTGIVLTFQPGPEFEPSGQHASVLSFVRQRMKSARAALLFTFLTGLLMAFVGLVSPVFSQIFMDDILSGKNPDWFKFFIGMYAVLVVFQFIVQVMQDFRWVIYQAQLDIEANTSFIWHVLHLPISFFQQRFAGDLVIRQQSNQTCAAHLVQKIAPAVVDISLLIIYLLVMSRYSLPLTAVGLTVAVLNLGLMRYIADKRMNLGRVLERDNGKLNGTTMSSIEGMETIKAAGAELGFFQRWSGVFATKLNSEVRQNKTSVYLEILPLLLQQLSANVILVLGAYLILKGELTIGMLTAFQGFMTSFMNPLNKLMDTGQTLIETRTQMERIEDVYNSERDVKDEALTEPITGSGKLGGKVEVRNVVFGYNPLSTPLLDGLSFTLEPGKSVALVGSSGCGKSTIAKLVSGLYEPWSGEILFDGMPRKEIQRAVFTNSVAMVDQDITLFEDSIANNVKIWDRSIEDFAMIMACRDAQIYTDIVTRPDGFNERLTEGGSNLSGGQRQRLEIASALAREPVVLILDEATSALDAATEERVMRSIRQAGISLIIIAHRLSTIRDCDEIIVLDKGHVMERGTHEALMREEGMYYQLMKNN
ncbi:MAG TPA: NHLP family bacteriocin export ABC transporter peptidase/permease/ATPase subunit [Candidatus Parabacteroides intestinigallinarum]|uniref:NHLP family bacteriocin export ABC transporter peptidase/permease/ATPase subunit n=1 Tax=Candidatus Parabacteroides intestinigallinarum TaxID=2838722 RepID=A0A9D1XRI1_9BACT|nr:NHLP family bacteriocin export ABC transporter peptidase/permease/ATPase subunit [Candidatus Parabacteroides intestinigallinarum]